LFLKLENLNVHYKVSGSGDPIVLIHGWGADISCFSKLRDHFSQKFKVYALDLPGFGLSKAPDEVWGSIEYANCVKNFISELKITRPIFLGHSLGGKIALHLAADNLIDTKKIILISSSGVRLPKPFIVKFKIYCFKLLRFLAKVPVIRYFVEPVLDFWRKKVGSNDYRNASGIMRSIMVKVVNEDVVSILPKVKVPALLLWGDRDFDTPAQAGEIMHRAISGSELKIISDSGHFPFLDNWEMVKQELDGFLL